MSEFDAALDDWDEGDEIAPDEAALIEGDTDADDDELTADEIAAAIERKLETLRQPRPYVLRQSKKRLAIVDTETDPFALGVHVKPFTLGFYDGEKYVDFWGADCIDQFFNYLATLEDEYIIYAHNGGKFDFFFFLKYLDKSRDPLIMGGRLVKLFFAGQEFRDSFSIIPQALSSYQKDSIDYSNFVPEKREAYKSAILAYQKSDCIYAYDLIVGFHEMFGDKVTIASASLPMLHSFTGFERMGEGADNVYRKFYYGGRNQCFETGILKGDWKVYDRNSMYPAVMRDDLHPVSRDFHLRTYIDDQTDFACIEAINDGALPTRKDDGGLDFTVKHGTFYATGHEIRAGLDTGTLQIIRVKHAWEAKRKASFAEFVDRFYNLRLEAKANGDRVRDILYKFCLNSGYGKFALNPRKFRQWKMTTGELPGPLASRSNLEGWTFESQSGDIFLWSRPQPRKGGFYNVATAASITGAARANLLRNLALARRPVYCDTDSIICEGFTGDLDGKRLGGWKLEATGDRVAIAGKKLYAVFNGNDVATDDNGKPKIASKGVRLSPEEIMRVCNGEEIVYENPVPNFKLDGTAEFVTRRINMTG